MTPTKSNLNKETCSPVSSNCVIWQGPDIACLNLCKGDSISDVMYKLAADVCTLIDNIGISSVDLSEIVSRCIAGPEPVKTLTNVLNLIIGKVVCISDKVDAIKVPSSFYEEPVYLLSTYSCLSTNLTVNTEVKLSDFVNVLAIKLCEINDIVDGLVADVAENANTIDLIKNNYYPNRTLPDVTFDLNGETKAVDLTLRSVQAVLTDYAETLGTTTDLSDAQSGQCPDLATATRLCGDGKQVMSTLSTDNISWNNPVTTLAQSLQNLWLTVCDIRCAVKLIQDNCCKVSCSDITVDFDYKWTDEKTLTLFFTPKTNVPLGFYDCGDTGTNAGPGNIFTFTDGAGREWAPPGLHFRYRNVTNSTGIVTNTDYIVNGYNIDFSISNGIDVTTELTITANVCFSDGSTSCIKCLTKTISAYDSGAKTCCEISNTSQTESVTVVYQICKN